MMGEKTKRQAIAILVVLCLSTAVYAVPNVYQPEFNPSLEIQKTMNSIKIDGKIEHGEWAHAVRAENFVERHPGENLIPDVVTVAYITYDSKNLYVAFDCQDDPAKIRATMCQRDQFYNNDAVMLLVDTYGNATWAYEFIVNPYGVQKDRLWSSIHGDDAGFDHGCRPVGPRAP